MVEDFEFDSEPPVSEDFEFENLTIDVRRLQDLIWDKTQIEQNCAICQSSEETIVAIHNDCLNLGIKSPEFANKWHSKFRANDIQSHFKHHFVPSQLALTLQKMKKKYDRHRQNGLFIEDEDEFAIVLAQASSGDFTRLYHNNMQGLFAHQKVAEKLAAEDQRRYRRLKKDVSSYEEQGEDAPANVFAEFEEAQDKLQKSIDKSFKMLSETNKHVIDIDKRYHDKTFQTVRAYIEFVQLGMFQSAVDALYDTLQQAKLEYASIVPEERATEIITNAMGSVKERMANIASTFVTETKKKIEQVGKNPEGEEE